MEAPSAGQCGADSRIGSIQAAIGAGPAPASITGELHVVPRSPGAVAGLAAVLSVRLGQLDLGRLVLPGAFILRPTDAGLILQLGTPLTFAGSACMCARWPSLWIAPDSR